MCNCWHVSITWWIHNIIHNWCPSHGLTTMYSDEHNVSIHMHWMHLIPPLSSLQLWQARPLQYLWQGSLHPLPHYIVECVWIQTSLRFRCMTLCGHTKWDNFTLRKKTNLKVCAHFHQHECVVVVGCVTFMSYEMVYGESLLSGDGSMWGFKVDQAEGLDVLILEKSMLVEN